MPAEGVTITHPNRDKASSKSTRVIVVILLLISAALMTVVIVGGWKLLVGATPVAIFYVLVYLLFAYFVARWNRGVLPVVAALAIIMAIFAAVAAPAWFSRDKTGFAEASLSNTTLGLLTLIIVGVQIVLLVFAMVGFRQAWNVEVERRSDAPADAGPPAAAGPSAPVQPLPA